MKHPTIRHFLLDALKIATIGGISLVVIFGNPWKLYQEGGWSMLWTLFWKNGLASAVFWLGNGYLSAALDHWVTWTEAPQKRLFLSLAGMVLYTSIAFVFVYWLWTLDDFGGDIRAMLESIKLRYFIPTLLITFFVSLFLNGRAFLLSWKATLIEAERLKKEQISARYETLKNQVNPHFLFNSLNVLASLVHRDANLSEKFIRQLSGVYRYILDSRDKEVVPLEEELETLRAYLFLMDIRFGTALQVEIDIPENTQLHLAPLTLQMLVENALKHNEVSKANPLHIRIFIENHQYIVVQNTLQGKNTLPDSTGVGLSNIRARYRMLLGKDVVVDDQGQYFTVKVPVIPMASRSVVEAFQG